MLFAAKSQVQDDHVVSKLQQALDEFPERNFASQIKTNIYIAEANQYKYIARD